MTARPKKPFWFGFAAIRARCVDIATLNGEIREIRSLARQLRDERRTLKKRIAQLDSYTRRNIGAKLSNMSKCSS